MNTCPPVQPLLYKQIGATGGTGPDAVPKCIRCRSCSEMPQLRLYSSARCLTDVPAQCTIAFLDKDGVASRDTSNMRYEKGFVRVSGTYVADLVNGLDTPSHYVACTQPLFGEGMDHRPPELLPSSVTAPQCVNAAGGCTNDCATSLIAACKPNYYAVMDGTMKLLQCRLCPPHSSSPAISLDTECQCDAGYAKRRDISAAAGSGFRDWTTYSTDAGNLAHSDDKVCFSCASDVFLNDLSSSAATGDLQQTAIACAYHPKSGGGFTASVTLPGPGQYVTDGIKVNQCLPGSYPNTQRNKWEQCPPGYECSGKLDTPTPCDGKNYFTAVGGSAACIRKAGIETCMAGQMLKTNNSAVEDNECKTCPQETDCGRSHALFAVGHNSSNPCTYISADGGGTKTFFACWPPHDDQSFDYIFPLADLPGNRLVYEQGNELQPRASLQPCPTTLLPPHAQWVTQPNAIPGTSGGRQCYFACLHGVSADASAALVQRTSDLVYKGGRSDLIPFLAPLLGVTQSADSASDSGKTFSRATRWATFNVDASKTELLGGNWMVPVSAPSSSTFQTASAWRVNTFLMVDEILSYYLNVTSGGYSKNFANNPICLSPKQAYVGTCPSGFFPPLTGAECALEARTSLYSMESAWGSDTVKGQTGFGVLGASGDVSCWMEKTPPPLSGNATTSTSFTSTSLTLAQFTPACADCMLQLQKATADYIENNGYSIYTSSSPAGFSSELMAVVGVRTWLWGSTWYSYETNNGVNNLSPGQFFNPYNFHTQGSCDFTCNSPADMPVWFLQVEAAGQNFSACVPCTKQHSDPICMATIGGYFWGCQNNGQVSTLDTVCQTCKRFDDSSALIQRSSDDYAAWRMDGMRTADIWDSIACRYYCHVNYTSNSNVTAYPDRPCVPCSEVIADTPCVCQDESNCVIARAKLHTNDGHDICGKEQAGSYSYLTYAPTCQPCSAFVFDDRISVAPHIVYKVLPRLWDAYPGPPQCLARCNTSGFHTLLTSGVVVGVEWVEQRLIRSCTLCSFNPGLLCGGSCLDGTFLSTADGGNTSSCAACNTTACLSISQYREECPAGSDSDAECVDCDPSWLRNAAAVGIADASLRQAVDATKGKITRQWAPFAAFNTTSAVVRVQVNRGHCYVACLNNYVPIDVLTGLFFTADAPAERLACIPCQSTYVVSGASVSTDAVTGAKIQFYSMWNASSDNGVTVLDPPNPQPGSVLAGMAGRAGACCMCARGRDTEPLGGVMCEMMAGSGLTDNVTTGTAVVNDGNIVSGGTNRSSTGAPTNLNNNTPVAAVQFTHVCCKNLTFNNMTNTTCNNVTASNADLRASKGWNCSLATQAVQGGGARRLLQASSSYNNNYTASFMIIKVKVQPLVLAGERQNFRCCADVARTSTELFACQTLALRENEFSKGLLYDQFKDYCRNQSAEVQLQQAVGRRLLQAAQNELGDTDVCLTGQYKPFRGEGRCLNCPDGSSTGSPWNGITSADYCACLPGFMAQREPGKGKLLRCVPCGAGFYRSPSMPEDRCVQCAEGMQTPVGMQSSGFCYCSSGSYQLPSGGCAVCEPGFYCDGLSQHQCPANSVSDAGAKSRGDCTCIAGWVGSLDTPDQQCFVPPPGMKCVNGSGVLISSSSSSACACAPGWAPNYRVDPVSNALIKFCTFGCDIGQFMRFDPLTYESQGCSPCPANTYSSSRQMMFEASKPESEQCYQCPPNYQTLGVGATAADACICFGALQEDTPPPKTCGSCGPNTYMQPNVTAVCLPCPPGLHSPPASVGIISCVCPAGQVAFYTPALACRPCPRGMYSASGGAVCTPCPDGLTTTNEGATAISQCVCPPGLKRFLNSCR